MSKHGRRRTECVVCSGKKSLEELASKLPNSDTVGAVSAHIEQHIGQVKWVFHENVSNLVHLDIHYVPAAPGRPFQVLVTSGMSDMRMKVPPGFEGLARAELFIVLPPLWPVGQQMLDDPKLNWPIRSLTELSRFPHEYHTWFGDGHTVLNGNPPEPFAPGVGQCGAAIVSPRSVPKGFGELSKNGSTIFFYQVLPLYLEEIRYAVRNGTCALLERFGRTGYDGLVDPRRENVCEEQIH